MATRGFLIRFIDIGLIVLFGFLMISDIEATSRVELAGAAEPGQEPEEPSTEERVFVVVEIEADGGFVVTETAAGDGGAMDELPVPGDTAAGEAEEGRVLEEGGVTEPAAPDSGSVDETGTPSVQIRARDPGALAEALEAIAARHAEAGRRPVVLIEPHPSSEVQRTVDVMDVCDRLGLDKSLRMDIEVVSGPR